MTVPAIEVAPPHGVSGASDMGLVDGKIYCCVADGTLLEWNGTNAWIVAAAPEPGYGESWVLAGFNNEVFMTSISGSLLKFNGVSGWDVVATTSPSGALVFDMIVHGGELYGACLSVSDAIVKWNGTNAWIGIADAPSGDIAVHRLISRSAVLYAMCPNTGRLSSLSGGVLTPTTDDFSGGVSTPTGLAELGGDIYGVDGENFFLKKWPGSGSVWVDVITDPQLRDCSDLIERNSQLYMIYNGFTGEPVYVWDGVSDWVVFSDAFTGKNPMRMVSFNGGIYVCCTDNSLRFVPDVVPPIEPPSIGPQSVVGSPDLNQLDQAVGTTSIPTEEAFGTLEVDITTQPDSLLSLLPQVSREGDIRIVMDPNEQYGELILADRDVDRDGGFETAVIITLLTDRRADIEDPLPDDAGYRGGSWHDSIPVVEGYEQGTKLWLLHRSKTLIEIPTTAEQYLREGFQWMIDDEIVESLDVNVVRFEKILTISISFTKPEGATIFYKFFYNWEKQILRRAV